MSTEAEAHSIPPQVARMRRRFRPLRRNCRGNVAATRPTALSSGLKPGSRRASCSDAQDFHSALKKQFKLTGFDPRRVTPFVASFSRESSDSIHRCFDNFVHSHNSRFSGDSGPLRHGDARPEFVSSGMTTTTVLVFQPIFGSETVLTTNRRRAGKGPSRRAF